MMSDKHTDAYTYVWVVSDL